jgi:ubiquinone/menaquinone biosynthesis C-methylase UbiE
MDLAVDGSEAGWPGERDYPSLSRLIGIVLAAWPEHRAYLHNSLSLRTEPLMRTSDRLAEAVLSLAAPDEEGHAADYRWLCGQIMEEELYFRKHKSYRFKTFAETYEHVYSNTAFMRRYMNGLLYSQVLWHMHASSLHFFSQRVAARVAAGGKVLEVGSGHGLLLFLALRDLNMGEAVAWDINQVSLDQTRHALEKLDALERARFAVRDIHALESFDETFDLIILSHLLEHLENPTEVLKKISPLLANTGLIYVNVPLNAPMPDHLILLQSPEEADRLLTDGGFRAIETSHHTTHGMALTRALRLKTAVTCSIIAERSSLTFA